MTESIAIDLKRAAIALADELDYVHAAKSLNVTTAEVHKRVSALETQLCVHIFEAGRQKVELSHEGQFLIRAFREAVALHDRTVGKDSGKTR